jgi:hypothetical protein
MAHPGGEKTILFGNKGAAAADQSPLARFFIGRKTGLTDITAIIGAGFIDVKGEIKPNRIFRIGGHSVK